MIGQSRLVLAQCEYVLDYTEKKVPRETYFETNSKPLKRFRTDLNRFQSAFKVSMKLFLRFRRAVRNLKKGLEFVSIL